ncbi:immunity 49 family protein [Streptomyces aureus]|uniref:immunity 49 family protein n=1 Tax=Streptomyces aureus TaxID=193461 RepID=UPI000A46D9A6|nr:immunity 49 family protein [Streptomyces aureus]
MVTNVPRHDFPAAAVAEDMAGLLGSTGRVLDRLEGSEMSRSRALESALTVAKSFCANDPWAGRFETWEAWVTAMQVGSALFDAAMASEGPVACRIGSHGEVKNLPATGPTSSTHAGAWVTSFYLAVICRDNARVDRLAQVPVALLRESGAVFDEYIYSWVETLQGLVSGRADVGSSLEAAFHGTDPEVAHVADKETLLKILYPPVNLFYRLVKPDPGEFNEALTDALTWHKEYWTDNEARSLSSDGLVALGPLALACMAFDNGFPIEVESEYLPRFLLQGNWVGEYAT